MDITRVLLLSCLVVALICSSVCSQKIPSFKQGYGAKGASADRDRAGVAKKENDVDKNASEKASTDVEKVKIKIADPPTLNRVPAPHSATTTKPLVLRTQPASISYPSHLYQLAGECFSATEKGYKYVVCPFFNVTQKEMSGGWNKFEGVLGVWREWVIENDTITGMQFVMGEKCGSSDREATVFFNCSTLTSVHTIREPHTCKYSMWLDTPLACFKGAMQVYQLFNAEQLKRWDSLDEGYYVGELTEQGLKAKRKEILTEANLLYSQELSQHTVTTPNEPHKTLSGNAPSPAAPLAVDRKESRGMIGTHMPLTHCIEQNLLLRKELKDVKAQLEELVILIREFPPAIAKYLALKNGTWMTQVTPSSTGTMATSREGTIGVAENGHQKGMDPHNISTDESNQSKPENGLGTYRHDLGDNAEHVGKDDLGPTGGDMGVDHTSEVDRGGVQQPDMDMKHSNDVMLEEQTNKQKQNDPSDPSTSVPSSKESTPGVLHVHGNIGKPDGRKSEGHVKQMGSTLNTETVPTPANQFLKPQRAVELESDSEGDSHIMVSQGKHLDTLPTSAKFGRETL